ncbi:MULTISPECIES: DUF4307 domain-containing protein [Micrococcaceae]|uniref:DUF4307 domain-containing protein n=1 Tax=Micrococcaceae TaxID=1268 RepID=UPI0008A3A203|nr:MULTISPECIES: DUF4307 domain-containing protein [Micrococcaceae]MCG7304394.1 DUF4307 domain-containing protein [Pseudoglutamicibacter albus]OFT24467.1 hypothetical protein HMPREF3175_00205 [Arthrobacter sp. HMSC08H08]
MSSGDLKIGGEDTRQSPSLANRYGSARRSLSTRGWWIVAVVGILLLSGYLLFVTLRFQSSFDAKDISYQLISDRNVEVTVAVTMDPGADVTCGLRALSQDYSVVGYREVRFQADESSERSGNRYIVQKTVPMRTTFTPVTAGHEACWRTGTQ